MRFSRHRLVGLPPLLLALTVAGCSSADGSATTAVPSPDAAVTELCHELDAALPTELEGQDRTDPEPGSKLTAGWGSPAIILRCGVERPPKMIDPKVAEGRDDRAIAGGVDGVEWLQERAAEGAFRFTTANRSAYVEVTVPSGRDSTGVLVELAPPIKSAIPPGIAG
ncbi:DUF3515 domain-containing protein [Streptomyces sp. NPDC091377]|uniref:DUF3515 domain-containing protein n=1 Tax=Streptomyces sp. NPDC091377 TaxID=3365995 RepID=UPI00380952F4